MNVTESYFTRLHGAPQPTSLSGYRIPAFPLASLANLATRPVWTLNLASPTEHIVDSFKLNNGDEEPVASYGKVLSERKVLYKYLHSNAMIVITLDSGAPGLTSTPKSSIYLVDSVSGAVLYHASVRTREPVKAAMSENWLVWTWAGWDLEEDGREGKTKGQHVVSVEFYEGAGVGDKTRRSALLSFSLVPFVFLSLD